MSAEGSHGSARASPSVSAMGTEHPHAAMAPSPMSKPMPLPSTRSLLPSYAAQVCGLSACVSTHTHASHASHHKHHTHTHTHTHKHTHTHTHTHTQDELEQWKLADYVRFAEEFSDLDTDGDGYISGMEARPELVRSGLGTGISCTCMFYYYVIYVYILLLLLLLL
jgi:hypothetical protein